MWKLVGDEHRGKFVTRGASYDFWFEDNFVQVRLPFAVDQEKLRKSLQRDGWAVGLGNERMDSMGWGEEYDIEGYYPCWVSPEKAGTEKPTIFSFPPKDYRIEDQPGLIASADAVVGNQLPVIASNTLEEFAQWIPYLENARKQVDPSQVE